MDTAVEPAMIVHRTDGRLMKFVEFGNGLYFHDPSRTDYVFLNTVDDNKSMFTPREIASADAAIILHKRLGRPAQLQFEQILRDGLIYNCPVTLADARRAVTIYGPCVANLKGTAVKHPSDPVLSLIPIPVPASILEHHKHLTLCVDIFYVQQIPFLTTISRQLRFRTVAHLLDRSRASLLKEVSTVLRFYHSRGFLIPDIHCDHEFDCIKNDILPCQLNITPKDDHVGEIERSIRTIKERVRTIIHGLPFRRLPRLMIREVVTTATKLLNMFPIAGGLSPIHSPYSIMTGRVGVDFNSFKLEFGSYVQVFEDNDPTNTTKARNTGAITLGHTGNTQGDYFFMSLVTGCCISRHSWTVLPMSQGVITLVETMATEERQPLILGAGLVFEMEPNVPLVDGEDLFLDFDHVEHIVNENDIINENDVPVHPDPDPVAPVANPVPNAAFADQPITDDDTDSDDGSGHADIDVDPADPVDLIVDEFAAAAPGVIDDVFLDPPLFFDVPDENEMAPDDLVPPDDPPPDDHDLATDDTGYNLRSDRTRSYAHHYNHQFVQSAIDSYPSDARNLHSVVMNYIMTQMSATAGIRKHGDRAVSALLSEFAQLNSKDVFKAVDATQLTKAQKQGALRAINLIKEKRTGALKGRTCADGRPQRSGYTKEETASPTMSTDALLLSLLIDAKEERDVATADVVGAYLNADMEDFVLMRLVGDAVDILCTVNPMYLEFVVIENGQKVLYVQLLKALYGCVTSALLWYDLFTSVLTQIGFTLNPYDACVANAIIDGSQCTIAWYVDDNKISHKNPAVVSDIISKIESKFGKMTVTRGKVHDFLGMNITFTPNQTVEIRMENYVDEALADFDCVFTATGTTTPAQHGLFDIDPNAPLLNTADSELFHRHVAKLLYLSKRGRTDIQLAIAFLTTRVSCSTTQDWNKLKRVFLYLKGTRSLFLTLGADSLYKLNTWVDAAYAVHPDMRSHTGGAVSMGTGAIMCKSTKQKLNTNSSTEAKVVGASDFLPATIWARMFLSAQGYDLTENVYFQDNQSAILLERNGRSSSGQKTRHIDIRYFFMQDRILSENLSVVYCPTECMLADFFTKPLQGALFRKFRDVLLGYQHISVLHRPVENVVLEDSIEISVVDPTPLIAERVEENIEIPWTDVVKRRRTHGKTVTIEVTAT